MKCPKSFAIYSVATIFLLWCCLFVSRVYMHQFESIFFLFNEVCGLILHVTTLIIAINIYKKSDDESKSVIKYLVVSVLTLLIVDIAWYIINTEFDIKIIKIATIINAIGFILWSFSLIKFGSTILKKYILHLNKRINTIIFFVLIDITFICLFTYQLEFVHSGFLDTHFIFTIWHVNIFVHIFEFAVRILVINIVIMCLIYSENDGLILFFMGVIALFSSYSLVTYAGILKKNVFNSYADMLWFLGLILNMFGLLIILLEKEYQVKKWVIKDSAVRGVILFFSFFIYTLIFALLFVVFYMLSIITIQNFLAFPVFYIVYIPIIIYAFIYFSKYLEQPFKHIINNIEHTVLAEKNKIPEVFHIDEFIFLQNFINNAFAYKNQTNQLQLKLENEKLDAIKREQERFRMVIGQLIHDMNSPLESINVFSNLAINDITESDKFYVKSASKKLSTLVRNVLNKYKGKYFDANSQDSLIVIPHLKQILEEKRLEYQDIKINLDLDVLDQDYFYAIFINTDMFHRMISNLINNAVDATKNLLNRKVILKVRSIEDSVTIFIKDNGIGMAEHIQDKFLRGVMITEGKSSGHGFGLAQVFDTIKFANAKLSIYASPNIGTEIVIRFAKINLPLWIADKLILKENSIILVLDNDLIIHEKWKIKFNALTLQKLKLNIEYFNNSKDFLIYLETLEQEKRKNIILLADYDLGEDINGIEIINKSEISNSILVTSYANEINLQNLVINSGIKMLPKNLIAQVNVEIIKLSDMFTKKVDMLWLDDQEYFVQSILKDAYNHLIVDVFTDPLIFLNEVVYYRFDTKIILDMYYEISNTNLHKKTGLEIAIDLIKMGFMNITILTGEELDFFVPENIKVIFKTDQIGLRNL